VKTRVHETNLTGAGSRVPGAGSRVQGPESRVRGAEPSTAASTRDPGPRTPDPSPSRGPLGRVAVSTVCLMVLTSCTDLLTQSRSSSILLIERIAAGANERGYIASDVLTCQSGGINCSVVEDTARVTTRVALKDPGTAENAASPSPANFITITRYRVAYRREDGRNTPGVDVPYPWDGGTTFTTISGIQTNDFVIVRAVAKIEPPLLALRFGGGANYIATIGEVTFYGHDLAGQGLVAKGTIQIDFADWGP